MSIAEKLTKVAENVSKVYEAGQKSMVDESKIIEKTVNGTGFVNINDVSEVPHDVKVELSSDTITDFSNTEVTVRGKNLWDKDNPTPDPTSGGYNFYAIKVGAGNTVTFSYSQDIQSGLDLYVYVNTVKSSPEDSGLWLYHKTNLGLIHKKGKITASNTGIIYLAVNAGAVTSGIFMNLLSNQLQIEINSEATEYESYKDKIYTSTPDGVVNVSSISPIMNISTNETDINISANYHKSYGMQTEYDNFWDTYQNYGERTDYGYAFAGEGWTVENLKPKYNIIPTSAYMMFRASRLKIDLVEYLKDLGITLDFSSAVNLQYVFGNSYFTHIGVFDTRKSTITTVLDNTFSNSPYLVTIDKIILKPNATKQFGSTFISCASLENIAFEGEINTNGLNLQWSTKLSKESITSIINALSTTTTGLTVTLSKTAVNNAFNINVDDETTYPEGSEYYTLRHSKDNWTISYV